MDPKETVENLVRFISEAFKDAGFSRAVVALSGGVDSATSCALTVRALGAENVYPLLLPYGSLNHQGVIDARLVINALKIPLSNVSEIDIKPLVDPLFSLDKDVDHVRKGNAMARMRMVVIFDAAKKKKALVMGTENKTEHYLGYFTRFGDEASDIEPLRNLYKTQVYKLAEFLGIPEPILVKKPTAGLWEGQTDEGEFGFSYKEADEILKMIYDEKKSMNEVLAAGFEREVVEKVQSRVAANAFKHHLPITP